MMGGVRSPLLCVFVKQRADALMQCAPVGLMCEQGQQIRPVGGSDIHTTAYGLKQTTAMLSISIKSSPHYSLL